jgi:hypothetical protein
MLLDRLLLLLLLDRLLLTVTTACRCSAVTLLAAAASPCCHLHPPPRDAMGVVVEGSHRLPDAERHPDIMQAGRPAGMQAL